MAVRGYIGRLTTEVVVVGWEVGVELGRPTTEAVVVGGELKCCWIEMGVGGGVVEDSWFGGCLRYCSLGCC